MILATFRHEPKGSNPLEDKNANLKKLKKAPRPGFEPGLRARQARVLDRYTISAINKKERQ